MENKEIAQVFKLLGQLTALHDEKPFRARAYARAARRIERVEVRVAELHQSELVEISGIGEAIAHKIVQYRETGTVAALDELLNETPAGVLEMLRLPGIGPQKVRVLWQVLKLESVTELLQACRADKLSPLKGFGEKTQRKVAEAATYYLANKNKFLYAEVEPVAQAFLEYFQDKTEQADMAGALRRRCPVLPRMSFIIACADTATGKAWISKHPMVDEGMLTEGIKDKILRVEGSTLQGLPFRVFLTTPEQYVLRRWQVTGSREHVGMVAERVRDTVPDHFKDEAQLYKLSDLPYVIPEMREAETTAAHILKHMDGRAVTEADIHGILHAHTTYSDGQHTLEEMAAYCREQGYAYLGITDHSKAAFYAGGLDEEALEQQGKEIDRLNRQLDDFTILKGCEVDILPDGTMDFGHDVMNKLDFVIASVHSVLRMTKAQATARLIRAVEHPHVHILGHMTGRLLLRRRGYPVDHKKVIDACAANNVAIELNANPHRLDIDWQWIPYALEKEVYIAVNPDAHQKTAIHDIRYGILTARKGGLHRKMLLNRLNVSALRKFFDLKR